MAPPFGVARVALPVGIAAAFVGWLGWRLVAKERRRREARRPPKAPCSPWEVLREMTATTWPLFLLRLSRETASPLFRLELPFGTTVHIITDVNLGLRLLRDRGNDKAPMLQVLDPLTAGRSGLLTSFTRSWEWQQNRKCIAQAFGPTLIQSQAPVLEGKLSDLYRVLDAHAETGHPVDMAELLVNFTLDFISSTAFHYPLKSLQGDAESEGQRFVAELDLALHEFVRQRIVCPWRRFMFWDAKVRRANQAAAWLRDLALRIMAQYRATHCPEELQADPSILAAILRSPGYADDDARAADVLTLLIGGHETTAHVLAWTLYELTRHPTAQANLQEELDEAFAAHQPGPPPAAALKRLPWLEACLKEALRLWPVAGASDRQLMAPLEYDGYVLPKGALVSAFHVAVSRPPWLPDRDEYRPERWESASPELEALVFAFAAGPRNCVGQNLAHLELRAVLAGLLHRYSFELAKAPEPAFILTWKPDGLQLLVRRRPTP